MQRAPVVTGALLGAAVAVLAGAAAGPVRLSPEQRAAVLKDIEKDRAETQAWLKSAPTSYLATISRRDFEGRLALTVGRAADNDIRVDDPAFEAHHLRVTVEGDRFHVDAVDPSARFVSDKTPVRSAIVEPSMIDVGRFKLRLSHQGFPGIIVFDPRSPHFRKYKGLKYFPPNLDLRYELPLTRNPKPETIVILSTRGNQRRATRVGWFEFTVRGTPVKLEAVNLLEPGVPEDELGIFFRDATTGKESYPLGRYVDVKKLTDGRYLLDFNFTYNPACAYSDHYNCPIPPRTNVLPVAIDAGEMDAHYH